MRNTLPSQRKGVPGNDRGTQGKVEEFEKAEELEGSLGYGNELMKSVLENDKETIDKGKMIEESMSQGLGMFTPDIFMDKLTKNYSMAKKLFGETFIQRLSGYNPKYIEKNIKVPEFQKELKKKIDEKVQKMKQEGLLDENLDITDKGIELASLTLYISELDNLMPRGYFGEKMHKEPDIHGVKEDIKNYRKGDRYRDISIKKSVKKAVRRSHSDLHPDDLMSHYRQSKGTIEIIYGIDASASMKGLKLSAAKKAGVALAYNAVGEHDKVGIIVFGEDIKSELHPTTDFGVLLKAIVAIKAHGQTDFALTIKKSTDLFSYENVTKHLILLTDALPTAGEMPEKETIEAVSFAAAHEITVSVVGLDLDKAGLKLVQKIVEIGKGKLYIVKELDDLDKIILEDYYALS